MCSGNTNCFTGTISNVVDGAFVVVDIDTLWKNIKTGDDFNWKGRVCKIYTKMNEDK